jgi:DNA-binding transcriptional regulator YbjK
VPPPNSINQPRGDPTDQPAGPDRKTVLADAAIAVLGGDGLRALTHRSVDARAGLPTGTCGYHYRTRAALLAAALRRIADLDRHDAVKALATLPTPTETAGTEAADTESAGMEVLLGLVERVGAVEVLATLLEGGPLAAPERTRARLVLMIDPAARRELGAVATDTAGAFVTMAGALVGSAGRGRLLVALLDGLVVDAVTRGTAPTAEGPALRDAVQAVWHAVTT